MRRSVASKLDWVVMSFVFSSCDFVDRSFCPEKQGRSRSHTNQEYFRLELDVRAPSELQKRIQAAGILRREPVLDSHGHQIGEGIVTRNAELLWTENERLVIQKRRSVQDILNALDKSR